MQLGLLPNQRIVVIADIHSNWPALEVIAAQIPKSDVVICLGDMVGYYDSPNEVCEWVRGRADFVIAGNHDRYCLGELSYRHENEAKYRSHWTKQQLNQANYHWLRQLPSELELNLTEAFELSTPLDRKKIGRIRVAHGSLGDCERYVYPDKLLNDYCEPETLLLLGHTHHPMIRCETFGLLLNPGSVGQPRDWNPLSSIGIIDPAQKKISIYRYQYPHAEYAAKLCSDGFDQDAIALLTRIAGH